MKIVHICVCGEFYEKYAYQDNLLPKYHRKSGHEVTIIAATYSRFDQKTGKVIQDKCKCKYLDDGTKVIRLKPLFPFFINSHTHFFIGLKKALDDEIPDLIFAHGVESPNYLYLSSYKKANPDVHIVYDNHTDYINSLHFAITRAWAKYVVKDIIVKKLLWTSNHFYGTTPQRCTFLHSVYGVPAEKIDLLPMGADDEMMEYDKKDNLRKDIRAQYSIKEDDFLIVTGGKIDRCKNIHTLVQAVVNLNITNIKILLFGSIIDEMKGAFDQLQSENVIYIGWIPSSDVYKYFYAADLIAFPGFHSVLWEQAVASKVPTAFTRIDGFEHVNFNNNCILFKLNTTEYYETILKYLFSNRQFYKELKVNADSLLAEQFLYSNIAEKVLFDVFNDNLRNAKTTSN